MAVRGLPDARLARVACVARVACAVVVAVAATLPATGCRPDEWRGPVEIVDAYPEAYTYPEGVTSLELYVNTCHGDPEVTSLVQEADRVEVEVTSTSRRAGDGCLDAVVLELDAPLGDRPLVDGSTGDPVQVTPVRPGS